MVFAKTDKTKRSGGVTAFIIDLDAPGISLGKSESKLGIKGTSTFQIVFENCEVSASRVLGKEGEGFKVAMKTLDERSRRKYAKHSSMAKLYASETAMWVATKGIQVHGGIYDTTDYPVERPFRDAKITEIYEGASEIQRIIIARQILSESL